jgi:hypothetical protein
LLCGCGEKDKVPSAPGMKDFDSGTPTYQGGSGGGTATGGRGGGGGGAGAGGTTSEDAGIDPLGPSISFISPTPATDPNSEDVITTANMTVRCHVERSDEPGAAIVDKSAVKLVLRDPADPAIMTSGVVSALSENEFEATFDVKALPNGPVTVECTAKDVSSHMNTSSFTTLIDQGPSIMLNKPQDKKSYALKTPMSIEFQVAPAPVAEGDDHATVESVSLSVGGVETAVTESTSTPGLFQTSIDFSDKTKFPVQPTAAQLQITATNARKPNAAVRIVRADVMIDGSGPTITVTNPINGSIQRGVVNLSVSVSDPSGIMPGSLLAVINNKRYTEWSGMFPTFSLSFDTNQLDTNHELTQLTINLTAIDSVGNKTNPPVSHFVKLDNVPPVIELDPIPVRESRIVGPNLFCTEPLDPVGPNAADDLEQISHSKLFRALVEDRTNHSPGAVFDFAAGVDVNSVELYMQPFVEIPLLVDTNGDGICDAINKSDDKNVPDADRVTSDDDPTKIQLNEVKSTGQSFFAKPGFGTTTEPWFPECGFDPGGAEVQWGPVCMNSDMYRVVVGRLSGFPSAVYAYQPTNRPDDITCNGIDWNIKGLTRDREGWLCLAARAVDGIGNVGVSKPLRVCYDDGVAPAPNCDEAQAPTCRRDCTHTSEQVFKKELWPRQ